MKYDIVHPQVWSRPWKYEHDRQHAFTSRIYLFDEGGCKGQLAELGAAGCGLVVQFAELRSNELGIQQQRLPRRRIALAHLQGGMSTRNGQNHWIRL